MSPLPLLSCVLKRLRMVLAAALVPGLALMCGCTWTRGPRSAVPTEIAACRELTERGTLAMQQGKVAAAEDQFRSALAANPADVDARRLFAEALWSRGEMTAALAQMEFASRLAPHDAGLTVRTGEMLLAAGEAAQALDRADKAIAQNPQYGPAWALRGQAHWAMQAPRDAIADYQRALMHAPTDQRVLLLLADAYLERGEPRRCLTTVHQLLDLCPPGTEPRQALALEGRAYLASSRPADAAESLHAAVSGGGANAELLYLLAEAELGRGRPDAAIRAAHRALAANSTHHPSHRMLAELNAATTTTSTIHR